MPRALKPEFQACKHIDALLGGNRRRQWAVLKMIGEALQTAVQSDPQVVVSLSFVVGDEDDSLGLPEITVVAQPSDPPIAVVCCAECKVIGSAGIKDPEYRNTFADRTEIVAQVRSFGTGDDPEVGHWRSHLGK